MDDFLFETSNILQSSRYQYTNINSNEYLNKNLSNSEYKKLIKCKYEYQQLSENYNKTYIMKRTIQIILIIMKNYNSKMTMLLLIYFGLCIFYETVIFYMGMIPILYGSPLAEKNYEKVFNLTLISFGIITIASLSLSFKELLLMCMKAKGRKNLLKYLQKIYLKKSHFYMFNILGIKFDYDQIISQDTIYITDNMMDIISQTFSPFLTIFFYTYQCCIIIGWFNTGYIFIYFLIFALFGKLASKPLTLVQFFYHKEEGNLRNKYSELREYGEEIALLNGTDAENYVLNNILKNLINRMYQIAYFCFNVKFITSFSQHSDNIILYLFVGLHTISDSIITDSNKISMALFYAHKLIMDLSSLVNLITIVSKFEANIKRIDKLLCLIEFIDKHEINIKNFDKIKFYDSDTNLRFEEITRFNSNEIIIVNNLKLCLQPYNLFKNNIIKSNILSFGGKFNFTVKRYQSFGITGASGCGKSLLLKYLAGIWKPFQNQNSIIRSLELDQPNSITFLPHKIFISNKSTVYEQLVYPHFHFMLNPNFQTEADKCLSLVGLEYLSHNNIKNSYNLLSSLSYGEKQRLMFARILMLQPILAIVDDPVSSLPLDVAINLYKLSIERGVTFISASQNLTLLKQTHHTILTIFPHDNNLEEQTFISFNSF